MKCSTCSRRANGEKLCERCDKTYCDRCSRTVESCEDDSGCFQALCLECADWKECDVPDCQYKQVCANDADRSSQISATFDVKTINACALCARSACDLHVVDDKDRWEACAVCDKVACAKCVLEDGYRGCDECGETRCGDHSTGNKIYPNEREVCSHCFAKDVATCDCRETVFFPDVIARAQLTTSAVRPCTYFVQKPFGRRFIKGPYLSEEAARVAPLVTRVKLAMCPSLPFVPLDVREIVPDGMPDCQFGSRMQMDKSKPHWFQVAADVFALEGIKTLPTTMKRSAKAWPKAVRCVDWKQLATNEGCFGEIPYEREYDESIYGTDPEAAKQLVLHVLLSWSCGCGADLAPRNFLYFPSKSKVYQVDLEAWKRGDWALSSAAICSNRNQKGPQMRRFIEDNWDSYFEGELAACMTRAKEELPRILRRNNAEGDEDFVLRRFGVVCDRVKLLAMFPPKVAPARKKKRVPEPEPKGDKRARTVPDEGEGEDEEEAETEKKNEQEGNEEDERGGDAFVGRAVAKHNHSVDPWGNPIDVAKSNFQKCVRRGKPTEAVRSFFACYNMETLFPDEQSAKAGRTNIINRLLVCAAEDVGVANVGLLKKCLEVALPMACRKVPRDPGALGALVALLAASRKSRVQSHLYHAYAPKNAELATQLGLKIAPPKNPEDPDLADPNCFALLVSRKGDASWKKKEDILWKKIEEAVPEIASLLHQAYSKASEINKRAFIQCALAVAHYSLAGGLQAAIVKAGLAEKLKDKKLKGPLLADLLLNKFELVPIPEAYDKHTRVGRGDSSSSTTQQFREVGALVTNPHPHFLNSTLEKIYLASKK